ncbi:MAG: hypothetical protein ABIK68_11180, partial [bacterium]
MTNTMTVNDIKKGRLTQEDCLKELKRYPDNCIDLTITDPPYGIAYYKYKWDKTLPNIEVWVQIYRVMKPGAFALILCSPRQDVLSQQVLILKTVGFDVGFTSLYWIYNTRMPKAKKIPMGMEILTGTSVDVAYAGFQPKPATEVILVVMKPLTEKSYTAQTMKDGKGATFLHRCAIPWVDGDNLNSKFMSNLIVSDDALDSLVNGIECTDNKGNSFRFSLDAWAAQVLPHLMVSKPSQLEKELGLDELLDGAFIKAKS